MWEKAMLIRGQKSGVSGQIWETRAKDFPNLGLDLIRAVRAVDEHNAIWLVRGQFSIRVTDKLVKLRRLLFHPIRSTPLLHSGARGGCIDIEHESNIGDAVANCETIQL